MPFPESIAKTFTSARFTDTARQLLPCLPAGRVNIRFMACEHNPHTGVDDEPVYSVYGGNFESSFLGNNYQNALTDFMADGDLRNRDDLIERLKEAGWDRDPDDGMVKHPKFKTARYSWGGAALDMLEYAHNALAE
ncbi:hypothetical protein [Herbaspirillum huttiense]|uniref:Uncharacterized protein n=1 Tax=Herbaspirillum huttiense subsp. lycopersici TaxID=3074428 RepID=A0ABU2EFY4_9BURK|nr:hypothetical protein [Herbaspirillum huttiense]MDR9847050.1 hypothetical protein [Herbaspirillum huttiense SE1]